METKTLKTIPKTSAKIWRPIIEKLDRKIEAACLRRDAYLNKVLETELHYLDAEVSLPNSKASYDYVFEELDKLDRKLVSLALLPELTARLNEICKRKRIVRDAFFNRLFLLLAASDRLIDTLLFNGVGDEWRKSVWGEYKHDGEFFQNGFYPLEAAIDPFWAMRSGLEMYASDAGLEGYIEPSSGKSVQVSRGIGGVFEPAHSIYSAFFTLKVGENSLIGMNTYIPDWRIPGEPAEKRYRAELDEMLGVSL